MDIFVKMYINYANMRFKNVENLVESVESHFENVENCVESVENFGVLGASELFLLYQQSFEKGFD